MLPFTRTMFFEVFAHYNAETWPAALAAYPLALMVLVFARAQGPGARRLSGITLALMWGWVGLVYHGMYFARINPAARLFAGAFILQSLMFGACALFGHASGPGRRSQLRRIAGAAMMLYAALAYPLVGLASGERFPAMPLFGVAPCPLVIFTTGLMLWVKCTRWVLWIIPLSWSVVGGSAALLLSVPQDWALPLSAIAALLVLLLDRHESGVSVPHPDDMIAN